MRKTAYDKDVGFLQRFLASRSPCLSINSGDIKRAERLLQQILTAVDRPLYVSIRGRGVFQRLPDQDLPVIRTINIDALQLLINKHKVPEITHEEIDAVAGYLSLPADATPEVRLAAQQDLPRPIKLPVKDLTQLLCPQASNPDQIADVSADSHLLLEEFLLRLRYRARGSVEDSGSIINPFVLTVEGGNPKVKDEFSYIKPWLALEGQIGGQYGIGDEPPALIQCLQMMNAAEPDEGILLLLEGFSEDFPTLEGRAPTQNHLAALEDCVRKLEKTTNQIALLAPRVSWENTTVNRLLTEYTLNFPDVDDLFVITKQLLGSVFNTSEELYYEVVKKMLARTAGAGVDLESGTADKLFDEALVRVCNSLRGLTESRIGNVIWTSIRSEFDLNPESLEDARRELIKQTAGLSVIEIEPAKDAFDKVGGLDPLKQWIVDRGEKLFMTPEEAKEKHGGFIYKGVMLIGLPGTGKSLITKAIASYLAYAIKDYPVSLVSLDVGALRGMYVGQTEQRTREALQTVEAFAPVVLWIDEIEKGFSGSGGDSAAEISRRMLGYFLTWMQERTAPVFLIATANDVSALPQEFKREGRWDAKFYAPLPDEKAALGILKYQLSKFKIPVSKIVEQTESGEKLLYLWAQFASHGFENNGWKPSGEVEVAPGVTRKLGYSGAEIEAAIKNAVETRQGESDKDWKSHITLNDLIVALRDIKPISRGKDVNGRPMGQLMYDLEQMATILPSREEAKAKLADLKASLKDVAISKDEINKILAGYKDLQKDIKKYKRNPAPKNFLLKWRG